MKKLTAMLMVLVLLTLPFAGAETATPSLILSSANPLPEIYERVSPSVVSVVLTTTVWDAATDSVKTTEQGGASAVCVNGDGYFLTNYHVVKEADEMEIRLADGTAYEAYTVGFDEALQQADFVFTGEGRMDAQSVRGKVISGVAARAAAAGVPVIAVVGDAAPGAELLLDEGLCSVFSINRRPLPFEQVRGESDVNLRFAMKNIARLIAAARGSR